jgi:hypothetical protein
LRPNTDFINWLCLQPRLGETEALEIHHYQRATEFIAQFLISALGRVTWRGPTKVVSFAGYRWVRIHLSPAVSLQTIGRFRAGVDDGSARGNVGMFQTIFGIGQLPYSNPANLAPVTHGVSSLLCALGDISVLRRQRVFPELGVDRPQHQPAGDSRP